MLLKKITIFVFTVKLLVAATALQAQTTIDTAKQSTLQFYKIDSTKIFSKMQIVQNPLPGNFYASRLPFFCNKELQIQKAVGIPIKVRVGSVDYVDKMEGKHR